MRNVALAAAASTFVVSVGFGLAGLGAAAVAEGQPAPLPEYHWCPGQNWDPAWGDNWDWGRCHDDNGYDGAPPDVAGPNDPNPRPGGNIGVGPW